MFRNEHPDHHIVIERGADYLGRDDLAYCSCGWKRNAGARDATDTAAGSHYAETRGHRVGQFRATCRLKGPVPLHEVPEHVAPLVDADVTVGGRIVSRWDHTLAQNVVDLPCDFETTDRAEYEAHMKGEHGAKPLTPSTRPIKLKNGVRITGLTPDGVPWRERHAKQPKALQAMTRQCGGCGLVVEVDGTNASALFIEEHKRGCALRPQNGPENRPEHPRATLVSADASGQVPA